ncbi:hypothetical protein BaRGS_00011050 [Batillaria attramentaria]|uniref:Uncharacterized protein n=1 Tax=Batillaria attramentaria TaxID=370345 RepID=A0ABD0LE39_9CAEN
MTDPVLLTLDGGLSWSAEVLLAKRGCVFIIDANVVKRPLLTVRKKKEDKCVIVGIDFSSGTSAFLTPADMIRWPVKPTAYPRFQTQNTVKRQARYTSRAFKIPTAHTEPYRGSFFVRTNLQWNCLSDDVIV